MVDLQQLRSEIELINSLLNNVVKIANRDGQVTADEKHLLECIEEDLKEYKILVKKIFDEKDISDLQRNKLRKFKKQIFEHAKKIAAEDGRYYEDEWHLLEPLIKFAKQGL